MHSDDSLVIGQLEFFHVTVVTLRLQSDRALLVRLVDNKGLHVILFPGSNTNLGNWVRAKLHVSRQLGATT